MRLNLPLSVCLLCLILMGSCLGQDTTLSHSRNFESLTAGLCWYDLTGRDNKLGLGLGYTASYRVAPPLVFGAVLDAFYLYGNNSNKIVSTVTGMVRFDLLAGDPTLDLMPGLGVGGGIMPDGYGTNGIGAVYRLSVDFGLRSSPNSGGGLIEVGVLSVLASSSPGSRTVPFMRVGLLF